MMSRVLSCAFSGVDTYKLTVETDVSRGLPAFTLVGLPDTAVRESRERVRAAIVNSGFEFPAKRITVNLAPADIPKIGSGYDLPIALGILSSSGAISAGKYDGFMVAGELALDGSLRGIKGALPMVLEGIQRGAKGIVLPKENIRQIPGFENIKIFGISTLNEALELDLGKKTDHQMGKGEKFPKKVRYELDFSQVKGQKKLKRAMEIAAAGGHNLLAIGPPGSGKTMMCQRIVSILPTLTREESLEVTKIYSIAGLLPEGADLIDTPPFRSPHHRNSVISLIGGGRPPKPGDATLAHQGVLFLDELPHFNPVCLDALRQVVSEGSVHLARYGHNIVMPADFMLLGAMNPCKCGYFGDDEKPCLCGRESAIRYMTNALSGPMADRFGLQVLLNRKDSATAKEQLEEKEEEGSWKIKKRVYVARQRQMKRQGKLNGKNTSLIPLIKHMSEAARKTFKKASALGNYSPRSINNIAWISMTIMDLDGREKIEEDDICEAMFYRSYDRLAWEHG